MKDTRFYIYTIGLLLITLCLWLLSKSSLSVITQFPFKSISQIFSLWGVVFLSSELLAISRSKLLEKLLGPLDRVYSYHKYLGIFSVLGIIIHATTLILNSFSIGGISSIYIIPTLTNLTYSAGIVSLYLFIITVVTTISFKLPYHIWKFTHKIFALSTLIASYHIITIGSDLQNSIYLKAWIFGFLAFGILSMLYKIFLYRIFAKKYIYKITNIIQVNDVLRINMRAIKKRLNYKPGQFAYFTFNSNKISKEEHPFSIISRPEEEELTLGIKMRGDYTKSLSNLNVGDTVEVRSTFGLFGVEKRNINKEVWLGAGVGITPILSLTPKVSTKLYYLSHSNEEYAFNSDLLKSFNRSNGNLEIVSHYSNTMGRFNFNELKKEGLGSKKTVLRVCAPNVILEEIKKLYKENKYPLNNLIYEDFELFN